MHLYTMRMILSRQKSVLSIIWAYSLGLCVALAQQPGWYPLVQNQQLDPRQTKAIGQVSLFLAVGSASSHVADTTLPSKWVTYARKLGVQELCLKANAADVLLWRSRLKDGLASVKVDTTKSSRKDYLKYWVSACQAQRMPLALALEVVPLSKSGGRQNPLELYKAYSRELCTHYGMLSSFYVLNADEVCTTPADHAAWYKTINELLPTSTIGGLIGSQVPVLSGSQQLMVLKQIPLERAQKSDVLIRSGNEIIWLIQTLPHVSAEPPLLNASLAKVLRSINQPEMMGTTILQPQEKMKDVSRLDDAYLAKSGLKLRFQVPATTDTAYLMLGPHETMARPLYAIEISGLETQHWLGGRFLVPIPPSAEARKLTIKITAPKPVKDVIFKQAMVLQPSQ